jgi:hypothetical protein
LLLYDYFRAAPRQNCRPTVGSRTQKAKEAGAQKPPAKESRPEVQSKPIKVDKASGPNQGDCPNSTESPVGKQVASADIPQAVSPSSAALQPPISAAAGETEMTT